MLYLREGLVCFDETDRTSFIHDLTTSSSVQVGAEQAACVRDLIRGLESDAADRATALMSPVEAQGFSVIERRDEPFDRVVKDRLERLDAYFSWALPDGTGQLVDLCEHAHSLLRHSRLDLDQLPVLPETAARRALLLSRLCASGAKVVLVGDDDLVSVAAAVCGLKPTVLDIDPDLVSLIKLIARRLDLDITVHVLDLTRPLPKELIGRFDAFCTDPENSRTCVSLFLSRGISLVRPGGIGLIASAEEWQHLIEDAIARTGLDRIAQHRRFCNYRDWSLRLAPYRADLHILSTTQESVPLVAHDEVFDRDLFPFGLTGKDSIMITARGCTPDALESKGLIDLLAVVVDADERTAKVDEHHPFPVRVVTVTSPTARAQASVRAQESTLDLVITPAPASEDAVRRLIEQVRGEMRAQRVELKALQRVAAIDV